MESKITADELTIGTTSFQLPVTSSPIDECFDFTFHKRDHLRFRTLVGILSKFSRPNLTLPRVSILFYWPTELLQAIEIYLSARIRYDVVELVM